MRRRTAVVILLALGAAILAAPLASAATDLYSNVGPGGSIGDLVGRYPLGNYVLDQHFSAVKASLTGGVDASGVPSMIAFFLANLLWQVTAFAANAVIELFALAFSVDLLNGSPTTAGSGALAPIADTIHNLYAHTLGEPWMEVAIILAGCWAMLRALVQRRYAETVSALSMSLVYCLIALAIVARPDATIGAASRWTNEIASAFLSVSAHGELTSGNSARRAASDELFEALVFRPWVALDFGGTEHCIRAGTGSQDHDPESVPVRPLAPDPRDDAAARDRLHRDGELNAGAKQCVDNTVRYPGHFLRYAPGSDDRDAEYEAVNRADPSKLPDSDPSKATYKPAVVDKPVTDAMEQGGQYQRLLLALVVLVGELGAVLLLGSLSVSVLLSQMVVLLLACFAPVALVAGIVPGRGHDLFKNWANHLMTYVVRKAAYALVLAVLLAALAALQDATSNLGWLLSFAMQSMFMWMVFLHRAKLAGTITAAVSGQHPERDTQLRRLLGIAYLARRSVSPARRGGGRGEPPPADDDAEPRPTDGDDPSPPSDATPPPRDSTPPPRGPSPTPPGPGDSAGSPSDGALPVARRTHGPGRARRDGGAEDLSELPATSRTHESAPTSSRRGAARDGGDTARAGRSGEPDKTTRVRDEGSGGARRTGDDARPVGVDRALEVDHAAPSPHGAATAPPSLADELRGDRLARRPAGELGDELGRLAGRRPGGEPSAEGDAGRAVRAPNDIACSARSGGELGDELRRLAGRRPAGELGDELDRLSGRDEEPEGSA
jgi:hypothetical protein